MRNANGGLSPYPQHADACRTWFPSASVSAEKMWRTMALLPTTVTLGSDKVIDL